MAENLRVIPRVNVAILAASLLVTWPQGGATFLMRCGFTRFSRRLAKSSTLSTGQASDFVVV
jgi:hypothetical protein